MFVSELVIRDIFFISWLGNFLVKFLEPLNPIFFSKYVIYSKNRMKFRYWIMLQKENYLYDVQLRLLLQDDSNKETERGVNKVPFEWELKSDPDIQNLSLARGIRYLELSESDSYELQEKIKEIEHRQGIPKMQIMIQGTTKNGVTYFAHKTYSIQKALAFGYDFVYTRQDECYDLAMKLNYSGIWPCDIKYAYKFYYENFDKLYQCEKIVIPEGYLTPENDVLSLDQIVNGQYKLGVLKILLEIINLLISFYLHSYSITTSGLKYK